MHVEALERISETQWLPQEKLLKVGPQEAHSIEVKFCIALQKCWNGGRDQFIEELITLAVLHKTQAKKESRINLLIVLVYYAGWADKYQQVFSAVNPVASSHFNFSILEPTGVVSAFAPENEWITWINFCDCSSNHWWKFDCNIGQ